MIYIEAQQGSPEWHAARCGVITASKFRDASTMTAKGLSTSKRDLYAAQVAIERISKEPCGEVFNSWQMKRGQEIEPDARFAYEVETGLVATESGVVLTDDKLFGYSTDGFVGDDGMIEIKSLVGAEIVIDMWNTQDMSEYMHQMQGGMWITGRKWCDFVMFCPQLANVGKSLFCRRVERDDAFIDAMVESLAVFEALVSRNEAVLRK
jgi:exodeoxyribonuclease (lambda-induced)